MFSTEQLIADCRNALTDQSPDHAIKEIVTRAVSNHAEVERVFAVPRSEFDPETLEERPYDVEKAKRVFLEANELMRPVSAASK